MFVSGEELQAMLARGVVADASRGKKPDHIEPAEVTAPVRCPNCRLEMAAFEYAHDSGVVIQRCEGCNGLWLEAGQLAELAGYIEGIAAQRKRASVLAEDLKLKSQPPRFLPRVANLLQSRWFSLAAAAAFVAFCGYQGGVRGAIRMGVMSIIGLAVIWCCESIGGVFAGKKSATPFPAELIALFGWFILVLFFFIFVFGPPFTLHEAIDQNFRAG